MFDHYLPGIASGANFPVANITSLKFRAAYETEHNLDPSVDLKYFIGDSIHFRLDKPEPVGLTLTFAN